MESYIAERPPFVFLSQILGARVDFSDGSHGRLVDLTARAADSYPAVRHALVRHRRRTVPVPIGELQRTGARRFRVGRAVPAEEPAREDETRLAIEVLDRQVVDTEGAKLERVNDVHLLGHGNDFYLVHVDVGFRGFFRRLRLLRVVDFLTDVFVSIRIREDLIAWKIIQPLAVQKGGELRLSGAKDRLSNIHPAELADIVEEVSHHEAAALLQAVEPDLAAETVAMLDEDDRAAVLEQVDEEDAADVLEELPADQTADILADLPEDRANDLMDELEPAYAAEVRALIGYHEASAGGLMTSDFVTVHAGATAADAVALLPAAAREGHFLSYLYMVDLDGRLVGVVSLTAILGADAATPLVELARDHFESATVESTADELLESFKKYRVQAIPVLDEAERPRGIVLLRGLLFETLRELSE